MLQQTRASVVIPYFERWLQRFPTPQALANASLEEVIKLWEGLGYYSRARALHASAQEIVATHGGELPSDPRLLATLKGIGPYTLGAILSFGFHQRASAIDGNTARVLARYFWIDACIDTRIAKEQLRRYSDSLLDEREPWVTVEALIELGATICLPTPRCSTCPLQPGCMAFQRNAPTQLPLQRPRIPTTFLQRAVYLIESQGSFLIQRGASGQVMADLYQFPHFEITTPPNQETLQHTLQTTFGLTIDTFQRLPPIKETFTRYQVQSFPYHVQIPTPTPLPNWIWMSREQLPQLPFTAGHRKLLTWILSIK